jgi:hypothetical protein
LPPLWDANGEEWIARLARVTSLTDLQRKYSARSELAVRDRSIIQRNFHVPGDRVMAVRPLTQRDLKLLGPAFDCVWPVEELSTFADLLSAIDEAEARHNAAAEAKG